MELAGTPSPTTQSRALAVRRLQGRHSVLRHGLNAGSIQKPCRNPPLCHCPAGERCQSRMKPQGAVRRGAALRGGSLGGCWPPQCLRVPTAASQHSVFKAAASSSRDQEQNSSCRYFSNFSPSLRISHIFQCTFFFSYWKMLLFQLLKNSS